MRYIGIDFETRSRVDIKKAGAYRYASDLSTDVLCLHAMDSETGEEWTWYPRSGEVFPGTLAESLAEAVLIVASNAEFDKAIWEFIAAPVYGAPSLKHEIWYCSQAQCRVNALPSALEKAARALGIKRRKDPRGNALIKVLSIPDPKTGEFNEDPKLMVEMGEYCAQDVRLMMQVMKLTRWMSATEHRDWLITCDINERGARIDTDLARLCVAYAAQERDEIAKGLTILTKGVITKHTQSVRGRDWVLEQCKHVPAVRSIMTVVKNNEEKRSFDKEIRARLLDMEDDLPNHVVDFIDFMDDGNKSSVAKFQRMLDMAEIDDRVRGAFVFAGAGQTQRFASRGLQLHNMRRDCWNVEQTEELKARMGRNHAIHAVMDTLSQLLRPAIIPDPGKKFVVSDWSAIEGRVLPWLTGDPRAEVVLDIYRSGQDIYLHTAATMGLTDSDRQIGKVTTLALGYQGAVGAFTVMGKNYGLYLPEKQVVDIVQKWRRANPWAVDYWRNCERAAVRAMKYPGEYVQIGRCQFVAVEGLIGTTLCGILPDNTVIQYPDARLDYVQTPHGGKTVVSYMKASLTPKADEKEWPRHTLYGGLIAENFTQGTAGALLKHSLRELDDRRAPVVLHVHDEIIMEVPERQTKSRAELLQKVMETLPEWADGLPLKAVPKIMTRYGK